MILSERYTTPDEIEGQLKLLCSSHAKFEMVVETEKIDVTIEGKLQSLDKNGIKLTGVKFITPRTKWSDIIGGSGEVQVNFGQNTFIFYSDVIAENLLSIPNFIVAHPKRKYRRIKVFGNPLIKKMYALVSMKVVDLNIKNEDIVKKIKLILSTIESHLRRSENYDVAKITLFDGTEKNVITELIKQSKKPFAVLNTRDFKVKHPSFLSYEDYIKKLNEKGYELKAIMAHLDKIKDYYSTKGIKGEVIVPLIMDEEVVGQIRVMSLKEPLTVAHVKRLIQTADTAVSKLLEQGSFELVTKEPQIVNDLSVGGIGLTISEKEMYKYIRPMKRIFIQLFFPDDTHIKSMATIVNIYTDPGVEPVRIGAKFSENMDHKDRQKLQEFINSIIQLERMGMTKGYALKTEF